MQNYPFLYGLVRHGRTCAWLAAVVCGGLSLWLGAALVGWLFGGALAAAAVVASYAVVRLMAELVRVITEMLLPQ